nr:hypothetical protein [Tanacetum cinerariifolium]
FKKGWKGTDHSLPHTDSEVEALVQKLTDEDKGRQNAILDLALQFENSCTAKDDLRNAYEKCTDISQECRALIDTFLKEDGALMWTQEYMQKTVEDVDEDDDFNSGVWINATNYVISTGGTVTGCLGDINNFLKKGKRDQVAAIVKSCSPNYLGDLNVTMKYFSGTVRETVHYKFLDVVSYGKDITV